MGDRCYVTLEIPKKCIKFPEILHALEYDFGDYIHELSAQGDVQTSEYTTLDYSILIELADVNYAEPNMEDTFQNLGIPYSFTHSPGDEYPEGLVVFDGSEKYIYNTINSSPVVDFHSLKEKINQAKKLNSFSSLDEWLVELTPVEINFDKLHHDENFWNNIDMKRVANKLVGGHK